jgi:hypothetical protein
MSQHAQHMPSHSKAKSYAHNAASGVHSALLDVTARTAHAQSQQSKVFMHSGLLTTTPQQGQHCLKAESNSALCVLVPLCCIAAYYLV